MNSIDKSVLATIIYYDVLSFPLTSTEAFNLLIKPNRISPSEKEEELNFEKVLESLEKLKESGEVGEWQGFYFLSQRPNGRMLVQERLEKNKIAEEKWKKTRRYLFWAQTLPYIEAIFASGSLALGHTSYDSDLDVLVVTTRGRIWLGRVLLSLLMSFIGVRRKNGQTTAPDKICLNHYITTTSLCISFESLYNAQTYAHLVPIYYRHASLVNRFWSENSWVLNFINNWHSPLLYQKKAVKASRLLKTAAFLLEKFLEITFLGLILNKLAKRVQLKRINTNLPGRVIANDNQLEFHPYSVEKNVLQKYNQIILSGGVFGDYHELDSGLK